MTSAPQEHREPRWRVLVVDDSPDDRADIRRLLLKGSSRRYDFTEAETGAAAIRAILDAPLGPPACVVLDYHLPDAEAPEVLVALLGPDGHAVCPVVVATGSAGQIVGSTVLRAGAQDYIGKAWMTAESLTRAVENAAERWAMARELAEAEARMRLALSQAQQAVRARDELVSLVSHDLRSPLGAIVTGLSVLEDEVGEQGRDVLRRMARQAQRMEGMLHELLDVAQLRAGMPLVLEPQETDLVVLTRAAAAEHQQGAVGHRIEVLTPLGSLVGLWDPRRIDRVVNNLLSNAVKYSPDGGRIQVSLDHAEDGGVTWAVLRITDDGLGIAASDQDRIFRWYSRGENALRTAIQGTGIGLAGARDIVAQHGGSISVESEEGRGSTFTVRLPTTPPPSSAGVRAAAPPRSA